MTNFNWGGRGMAFGQSRVRPLADDNVTLLQRSKDLSSRLIERNGIRLLRLRLLADSRNDGVIVRLTAYSLWPKAITIIFCVLFSGLLVSPAWAQEAKDLVEIQPLKVGDKIPDGLWDLPLKVVNHPEGKDYIKLSDYRDKKLIILDFWGTWCGTCISALPMVKTVQNEFVKDIIAISITNERSDKIEKFIGKNEVANAVKLWSVVEDSVVTKWIAKYTYPHFTWVADGKVLSHTSESALKVEAVKGYLDEGRVSWVEKVNLDHENGFSNSLGGLNASSNSFYYEGYLDGAGGGSGSMPYIGGRINYYFINYSQRGIYEWFLKRIARAKGENLKTIKYADEFIHSLEWRRFDESSVTLQIITNSERSLEDVFAQYKSMSMWWLEKDSNGFYSLSIKDKEDKV